MFQQRLLVFISLVSCAGPVVSEEPLAVLEGHENVISALEFTPDGRQLVSASWDKTLKVWNVAGGSLAGTLPGHRDWVMDVWLSPDGKTIASASQRTVKMWSRESMSESSSGPELGGASVNSLAFSPPGQLIATGGRNGAARIWNLSEFGNPARLTGFESWVSQVAFTPDEKRLVTGTRTGRVRVFDVASGKLVREQTVHEDRQVMELSIDPGGDVLLTSGYEQRAVLWNLQTGAKITELTGHRGIVTSSAWSQAGDVLATGERHGSVHLWNANDYQLIRKIIAHPDQRLGFSVTAMAISPDGKVLATGSYDKTIKLWRLATD